MSETKLSNPKDLIGASKLPLHLWPTTATAMGCMAFLEGALKYGRSNYRVVGVRASIYKDALDRHMNSWFEGEDIDPASGLPHLAKALACIAIIVDAQAAGELVDDRMVKGGYAEIVEQLTPHVERLKALHSDVQPKHYTIRDTNNKIMSDIIRDVVVPEARQMLNNQSILSKYLNDDYRHEDIEGDPNYWGV